VAQLIVSFAATDQDLAFVFRLGIIDQLHCSVQLADGICDPTFLKQQKTVLSSRNDSQLAERSPIGQLLGVDQETDTSCSLAQLMCWIAQAQQNSRR
jgi:hypothetical protein